LNTNVFNPCDTIKLSFVLRNTGGRDGDEVAQAYFRYPKTAPQPSPRLSLCGFERVHLARGQAESVTIDIPVSKFRSWDTSRKQYVIVPGDYELLLGAASDDIRHQLPLEVKIN